MKEVWKDIEGYEGLYQVSNYGNIKSLERSVPHPRHGSIFLREKLRKFGKDKEGRLNVTLSYEGVNKLFGVAVLVAKHFLENPNNLPLINHKDGDLNNNKVTNLEYMSHRDMTFKSAKKDNLTSDYFGVWFDKSKGYYCASISIRGKIKKFSGFDTQEDAARAYNQAYINNKDYRDVKFKINDYEKRDCCKNTY